MKVLDDVIARAVAMRAAGKSTRAVAKALGISQATVWRATPGVIATSRALNRETLARVIAMRAEGLSARLVAELLGISHATVTRATPGVRVPTRRFVRRRTFRQLAHAWLTRDHAGCGRRRACAPPRPAQVSQRDRGEAGYCNLEAWRVSQGLSPNINHMRPRWDPVEMVESADAAEREG
jgi:DNA-binding CsgD family transcriptional regulator